MGDGSDPADADGPRASDSGRWARPVEDLADDRTLRRCRRVEFEGAQRPSFGRYALLSKLGHGAMGVVYLGVHVKLLTEAAVKVLSPSFVDERDDAAPRFEREARLAARVRSPHLVAVSDVDEDEASGNRFIVMEYVRGVTAEQWARAHRAAPQVPWQEALDVAVAATRGLAAAHAAGIVHRDVKPANVFVPCGASGRPRLSEAKLGDLGLARGGAEERSITRSSFAMGTPGFMAPEQAQDAKRAGPPADVFGVGTTLYALLTGASPYAGTSVVESIGRTARGVHRPLAEARPDVPAAVAQIVERCLLPDPATRPADGAALLEALLAAWNPRTAAEAPPATPTRVVAADAPLRDLAAWDGATTDERRAAAALVAARRPEFAFASLRWFEAGGLVREVALFAHERTGLEFALVPAGTFVMGSPQTEPDRLAAETPHSVTLTSPYLVARTPATQDAFARVLGPGRGRRPGSRLPATDVTWEDARGFCAKAGLALPTEAQWERACRAGTTTRWSFGDDEQALPDHAWYFANSGGAPREVGRKAANAFGLFDVHGDVWEWCADAYAEYPGTLLIDPETRDGVRRVVRGGAWGGTESGVRSAFRGRLDARYSGDDVGLRPVRTVSLD